MSRVRIIDRSEPLVTAWVPESDAEHNAIREQMERILASPLFKNSKRYPSFLRYVIERTLEGHTDQLKERILGIEVFRREPDYDSNLDPVVRTTAGEVRKRIAQYYYEPEHAGEIQIELPPGSYIPKFRLPAAVPAATLTSVSTTTRRRTRPAHFVVGALVVALVVASVWLKPWARPTALDSFWRPVLASPGPVLLCVAQAGDLNYSLSVLLGNSPTTDENTLRLPASFDRAGSPYLAFGDASTLSRLTGLLQANGKNYHIRSERSVTLADLREGPVILIGAFNNDWTMRLTRQLRFRLVRDMEKKIAWIDDQQRASRKDWQVDLNLSRTEVTEDYAIISRVVDQTTERFVVVAAGVEAYGTMAAGEFLTDPAFMEAVAKQASGNWQRKNIQIVLGTKVINGNSGPPRVLATYYW